MLYQQVPPPDSPAVQATVVVPSLPDTLYLVQPQQSSSDLGLFLALIPLIMGFLALGASIWYNRKTLRLNKDTREETAKLGRETLLATIENNRKTLEQSYELLRDQQLEGERQEIYRKLNEFYGPCQILLQESDMFTKKFKQGREFRTLLELLEGKEYTGNDKVLLEEIMSVTDMISELIIERSGLVEDDEKDLQKLLAQARAHYRILRLAHKGKLSGEVERFKDSVYPRGLDELYTMEDPSDTK